MEEIPYFLAIDLSEESRPLKVQQLSWEEHADGKVRLHFRGIVLDDKFSHESSCTASGFCGDGEESPWLLCQVIKGRIPSSG